MLDPNSYRTLAVSGTMHRLYHIVYNIDSICNCHSHPACSLVHLEKQDTGTQFGFYPGRNALQPMFNLRHLQHAA